MHCYSTCKTEKYKILVKIVKKSTKVKDIFREHYEVLITELVMFKEVDTAKRVVATLNRDWLEVLKLCIPKIVVFILPQFAASRSGETSNEQVKKRTAHATACYDLLAEQVTKEVTTLYTLHFTDRL